MPRAATTDSSRESKQGSRPYFEGVAVARFAIRKAVRIVDEEARRRGLEPMEHQALIQIYGAVDGETRVNVLAERLDVPAAYMSRLVARLVQLGFVEREQSRDDKRVRLLRATDAGRRTLETIDEGVRVHLVSFQHGFTDEARLRALSIFASYVGCEPGSVVPEVIPAKGRNA